MNTLSGKLFEDVEYKKSWETRRQITLHRDYVEPDKSKASTPAKKKAKNG